MTSTITTFEYKQVYSEPPGALGTFTEANRCISYDISSAFVSISSLCLSPPPCNDNICCLLSVRVEICVWVWVCACV